MPGQPELGEVRTEGTSIRVTLFNRGAERLPSGHVIGKWKQRDGSVQALSWYNGTDLEPGEKTRVEGLVMGGALEVHAYRPWNLPEIPMTLRLSRHWLWGWRESGE